MDCLGHRGFLVQHSTQPKEQSAGCGPFEEFLRDVDVLVRGAEHFGCEQLALRTA